MPDLHSDTDRCFYCASDYDFRAVRTGLNPHLTIHMSSPLSACPSAAENFPDLLVAVQAREESR